MNAPERKLLARRLDWVLSQSRRRSLVRVRVTRQDVRIHTRRRKTPIIVSHDAAYELLVTWQPRLFPLDA